MAIISKHELMVNFADNIEKERQKLSYSQEKMAQSLDISLSTYKNMINGLPVNISIYSAYLAYKLTGMYCFELCGLVTPQLEAMFRFRDLPEYRKKTMANAITLESALQVPAPDSEDYVDCYTLINDNKDNTIYNSAYYEPINIAAYKNICPDSIDVAVKLVSNQLHPMYYKGDILLIHQDIPKDGDTGVFIEKSTQRIYIRRSRLTDPVRLEPVLGRGKTIVIPTNEMPNWIIFGYIMTKIR